MFQSDLGSEVMVAPPRSHDSAPAGKSGNLLGVTAILMERAVLNYSRWVGMEARK